MSFFNLQICESFSFEFQDLLFHKIFPPLQKKKICVLLFYIIQGLKKRVLIKGFNTNRQEITVHLAGNIYDPQSNHCFIC